MCYFVACAKNCKKCDINGPDKCDTDGCASDFHFNNGSKLCDGECFGDYVVLQYISSAIYRVFSLLFLNIRLHVIQYVR